MASPITRCSNLVLALTDAAFRMDADAFQEKALTLIDNTIGFDRAWWGIMSPRNNAFELKSAFRANLPLSYEEHWKTVSPDDRLAESVRVTSGTTVSFDTTQLHSTRGLYEINAGVGNRHALCTSIKLPEKGEDFMFLSLFRGTRNSRFGTDDVVVKQFVMPQLHLAWQLNLVRTSEQAHREDSELTACVFLQADNAVFETNPEFVDIMKAIWPDWRPPFLPDRLIEAIAAGGNTKSASLGGYVFRVRHRGALRLLSVFRQSAQQQLTKREFEIASAFANGQSYKNIARDLGIAPATVRHHLRAIYTKLGVTDKSTLTRRMPSAPPALARQVSIRQDR